MKILYWFQDILNKLSAHPLSLAATIGFLFGWTTTSLLSHGTFDNGLGIENLIINGLSILLLFSANSHHEDHKENAKNIRRSLDDLHDKVDDLKNA